MKDQIFFHIRGYKHTLPHTYCVKRKDNDLYVGYSIVHENDQFCRKIGRQLAEKKVQIAFGIKDEHYQAAPALEYPDSISETLPAIVQRAGEIMGLQGKAVYVKTLVNTRTRKIPYAKIFDIETVIQAS